MKTHFLTIKTPLNKSHLIEDSQNFCGLKKIEEGTNNWKDVTCEECLKLKKKNEKEQQNKTYYTI